MKNPLIREVKTLGDELMIKTGTLAKSESGETLFAEGPICFYSPQFSLRDKLSSQFLKFFYSISFCL